MAISKQKKTEVLGKLTETAKAANSIVFVSFKGISANNQVSLRKKLKSEGVGYNVVKKTLLKKALEAKGVTGDMPDMPGELAISYSTDLLAPAREIHAYSKVFKNNFQIVGGVFEGVFKNKAEMTAIATIPSRETLLSQIAFLLKSPMQRLAIAVNEVSKKK